MATIPITGVPSNYIVPGTYAEILFAQGPSTASAGERTSIYVMPMTSSGTYTANTVYQVKNESDVLTGAGPGSPLHRAIRKHLKANKNNKVYALPYAASSGAGAVAADGDVVITGPATGSGKITVVICGETIDVAVSTGDTATSIGDLLVLGVNSKTHLPVTAANSNGTVTLTAKIAGASQGDGTIGVIRYRATSSAAGVSVSTTGAALGLGTGTAGVDGATTEAANLTTALTSIDSTKYYYIGISDYNNTSLSALGTHISNKSEPLPGLRSVGVCGFTGSVSAAQTKAITRNYERLQMVTQPNSEHDVAELVGNMIAIRNKYEVTDPAYNFDGFNKSNEWLILPVYTEADYPDSNDINDALTDGVCIIASRPGSSYLVMSVGTRSKNADGVTDDFRALETHRVSVADYVVDTHIARHNNTYANFKLKDDEYKSDGSVNTNQKVYKGVLTPSQYKPFVVSLLRDMEAQNLLRNVQDSIDSLIVQIDNENTGRLEVGYDLTAISLLHQTTIRVAEVSAG